MDQRIKALFASAALSLCAGTAFAQEPVPPAAAAAAPAAPAAAAAPALGPSMTAPLAGNGSPTSYDLGPLGNKVYITGVLSGLGYTQSNHINGDQSSQADLSNAQVIINKVDGVVQYFVQAGLYSLPALGTGYAKATTITPAAYDYVPMAYIKIVPNANFSIQAGKLPTLIGSEYTFTFQNSNIERGLLWGQEPAISRGVQANYTTGPWAFSVSLNDGLYSNRYTTVSGAITYTHDPANILIFSASGNTEKSKVSTFITPTSQNDQQIYNLIYTHTTGPWSFTPYLQYSSVPSLPGIGGASTTYGGALLAAYTFDSKGPAAGWSLPARVEYTSSTGSQNLLFFGPKANAWSLTITPTYQYKVWFIRGEASYTSIGSGADGFEFGTDGTKKDQFRGLIETGVLF
jgi:Putative beta-barrel porin-2, OmpL-like. bbp2